MPDTHTPAVSNNSQIRDTGRILADNSQRRVSCTYYLHLTERIHEVTPDTRPHPMHPALSAIPASPVLILSYCTQSPDNTPRTASICPSRFQLFFRNDARPHYRFCCSFRKELAGSGTVPEYHPDFLNGVLMFLNQIIKRLLIRLHVLRAWD